MTTIRFPEMRNELISCLKALLDPGYQRRIWVEGGAQENIEWDDFDRSVHFLYDDTTLATNPSEWIGLVLLNEAEVQRIAILTKAIDVIFDKDGTSLTDAQYIALPEWAAVVEGAKAALQVIHD